MIRGGRGTRGVHKRATASSNDTERMPRGYDALRDVLASANSPTQLKPHIRNLLNDDPAPPPRFPSSPSMSPVAAPIPYSPITRRTPPTSVLLPLTPEELESFKTPRHALRIRARRPDPALDNPNFFPPAIKRKRDSDDDDKPDNPAKRSRDVGLVVNHCESPMSCPVVPLLILLVQIIPVQTSAWQSVVTPPSSVSKISTTG
jgi:hypothetical protein